METFSEEIEKLRQTVLRPLVLFFVLSVLFLVLSPTVLTIHDVHVPFLRVGTPSLATLVFLAVRSFLIPANVSLVVLGPVSAFVAPIIMAFLVSLLITFPYILFSFERYLRPALFDNERHILYTILVPAFILFYLGCALGFFFIIPKSFAILYAFASPIGVTPLFSLDSFISSVFLLTISTGAMFLLPVLMVLLSRLSLVSTEFWLSHWKGALITALIFSAVVTPDGSGVTMILLFIPLMILYALGIIFGRKKRVAHLAS